MTTEKDSAKAAEPEINRRNLLKLGAIGSAAVLTGGVSNNAEAREDGIGVVEHDEFPQKISPDYKRFSEGQTMFSEGHRNRRPGWWMGESDENKPGFGRVDKALANVGWSVNRVLTGDQTGRLACYSGRPTVLRPRPGTEPHKFKNSSIAHAQIKRVARMIGADVVGITRHDDRWDYSDFYSARRGGGPEGSWEENIKDFKPKTVIVMGIEMDYEGLAAAPSFTTDGVIGEGYSRQVKASYQMAVLMNELGYNAIAAGNGVGLSVPYAIAAGLGEHNRMGLLQNYKYGTRLRLCKVYTDLELDEYLDKPVTFGVQSFCENCMFCSDRCPADCISKDTKPSMSPPNAENRPYNNPGVYKWYAELDKCLQYWRDSQTNCGTCVSSCPFNKPNFWHHRLIDRVNTILPGPIHKFMAEMDKLHGYGDTFDTKAAGVFWSEEGRKYSGMKGA